MNCKGIFEIFRLTGFNPFKTDDYKESLKKNYEGVIHVDRQVKQDTQNFLQDMLERNPKDRLSTHEALEHSVFCQIESNLEEEINPQTSFINSYKT